MRKVTCFRTILASPPAKANSAALLQRAQPHGAPDSEPESVHPGVGETATRVMRGCGGAGSGSGRVTVGGCQGMQQHVRHKIAERGAAAGGESGGFGRSSTDVCG